MDRSATSGPPAGGDAPDDPGQDGLVDPGQDAPDDPGQDAPDDAAVPAPVVAGWLQAEAGLFSAVVLHPALYQRTLLLVGATVERLRTLGPSTSALLDAASSGPALPGEVSEQRGLGAAGLDLGLVARAALAVRHRDVVAEQTAARRRSRLARERVRGACWVVLEESGDFGGDPFRPYRRLEAEPATGRALLVTSSPDEQFRSSVHAVEVLQVDLRTGQLQPSPDASDGPTLADVAAREECARHLRRSGDQPGATLAPPLDISDSERNQA